MKRTSMFLDRDLVHEAELALGTEGPTETVHAAMREIVRQAGYQEAGRRLAEMMRRGELVDPEYADTYFDRHNAE